MSGQTGFRYLARLGAALTAGACLAAAAPAGDGTTVDLGVAGRANAEPSVAARDRFVVVTWAASTRAATDIFAAVSRDGGRTFRKAVRVNDAATTASVSGEQPPRAALIPRNGREPGVVIVWTVKGSSATRLVSARSEDGGASFGAPESLPGSDAPGNRGWESTAVAPDGRVVAIWLDHRDLAASGASMPMHHDGQAHTGHGDAGAVARAQQSRLYVARLGTSGARAIASGVCYCCSTAVAADADGSIYAAWRHVYPGNVRDIAFTSSHDGGRTFASPIRVSQDRWALDGCPENGPSLAVDSRKVVHVVWPTLVNGTGLDSNLALFHASTHDGREFSARERIPTEGTPRHPQIAMAWNGSLAMVWDEQLPGTRRVVIANADIRDGGLGAVRRTVADTGRGEYPAVASTSDGFIVAWTSGQPGRSIIRTRTVRRPRG